MLARALDTFAHALSLIQASYVDPVDERELLYDAIAGMASQLDVHSAFLRPQRYQRLQEDTEGEFGDVGISLAEGAIDPADPRRPPWPIVAEVAAASPAAAAGVQPGDALVAIDGAVTTKLRAVKLGAAAATAPTPMAWVSRLPAAPPTVLLASTPVSSDPTMPPTPCTPNTSSESSTRSSRLSPVAPQ